MPPEMLTVAVPLTMEVGAAPVVPVPYPPPRMDPTFPPSMVIEVLATVAAVTELLSLYVL